MRRDGQMKYTVFVDDNFHHMDEEHRCKLGDYDSLEEAVAAAKKIVDDFLKSSHTPGLSAEELLAKYKSFGEDPWISSDDAGCKFSAWDYAQRRCREICGG
jgi:hypothetical protein